MNLFTWLSQKAASFGRNIHAHGWCYTLCYAMEKLAYRLWVPVAIAVFFLFRILPAYHRYAALERRTGGAHIYCQYYHGTGDVRYSAAYLRVLYDSASRQSHAADDVFIVSGKSAAGVVSLFCPQKIPIILWRYRAAQSMVHFLRFMGPVALNMTILHYFDDTMYTSVFLPVMCHKGATFEDLYTLALLGEVRTGVPGSAEDCRQALWSGPAGDDQRAVWPGPARGEQRAVWPEPIWDDDDEWVEQIFKKNGLKPHRTVLVSPFANSLAYAPGKKFWESIVMKLRRKGYSVCTNVAGRREKPIRGSIGISIPYKYLNVFCVSAGYFLAYRSGLCDLISTVRCRKVILYPDKGWPDAKKSDTRTIDVFSLKRMGYGDDVEEYVYRTGMDSGIIVRALLRE